MVRIIVPKLRFKEFNDGWKNTKLSNFITKITDKNKKYLIKNVISNSAQYGLIPQKEFFDKDIANDENINNYYIIEKGDFVYNPRKSIEAPYGPVNMYCYSKKGIISPLYLCFKVFNINKDFLLKYFKTACWHKYIYENGDSGARHDRVSIKDDLFFELPIFVPSMQEQEKIGKLFELLDKKIELQKQKIEALKLYKFGFIKQYFKNLKHYTEVAFDEIGKEYSTSPLGKDLIDENGKKPIIFYGDIFTIYEEIIDEIKNFTNYDIKNIELSEINDIILPSSTTVDALSLISASAVHIKGAIYGGDIILYRINNNIANSDYVSYQINYDLKHTLAKYAQGSTIIHIYFEHFKKIKLKLPIIKEQEKMVNLFNLLNKKINYENSKFKVFNYIKKSLLQQLFI